MTKVTASKVDNLRKLWQKCASVPGGRWVFSKLLKYIIPYSGSIDARIIELAAGEAKVKLRDRRKVRNHLNSIHAIALINLGELSSGLALNMGLKNNIRGIVTEINIQYHKKARGDLVAKCQFKIPDVSEKMDYWVETQIYNNENDIVATTRVCWRLSLIEETVC